MAESCGSNENVLWSDSDQDQDNHATTEIHDDHHKKVDQQYSKANVGHHRNLVDGNSADSKDVNKKRGPTECNYDKQEALDPPSKRRDLENGPDDSEIASITQAVNERLHKMPIFSTKQGKFINLLLKTPPLGLKSVATPSFIEDLQTNVQPKIEDEMKRVSRMNVLTIKIGSWMIESQHHEHIMAKFFIYERRMMWEVFENGVKNKIEIQFDDIVLMTVHVKENTFAILRILVKHSNKTPMFYIQRDTRPRRHIINENASDFTRGEAMRNYFHMLLCPQDELDKHLGRLIRYEPRFLHLIIKSGFLPSAKFSNPGPGPCDIGRNVSVQVNSGQQSNSQDPRGHEHGEKISNFKSDLGDKPKTE